MDTIFGGMRSGQTPPVFFRETTILFCFKRMVQKTPLTKCMVLWQIAPGGASENCMQSWIKWRQRHCQGLWQKQDTPVHNQWLESGESCNPWCSDSKGKSDAAISLANPVFEQSGKGTYRISNPEAPCPSAPVCFSQFQQKRHDTKPVLRLCNDLYSSRGIATPMDWHWYWWKGRRTRSNENEGAFGNAVWWKSPHRYSLKNWPRQIAYADCRFTRKVGEQDQCRRMTSKYRIPHWADYLHRP